MGRKRAEARRRAIVEATAGDVRVPPRSDDPVEALITRARKLRERGEARRSLVLLRQACALDEWRPRSYTLLGVQLAREGRHDEAARALNQARWLRARAGDRPRAAATERLAAQLLPAAA
jgi:Flp pilus assembly protein TadD